MIKIGQKVDRFRLKNWLPEKNKDYQMVKSHFKENVKKIGQKVGRLCSVFVER